MFKKIVLNLGIGAFIAGVTHIATMCYLENNGRLVHNKPESDEDDDDWDDDLDLDDDMYESSENQLNKNPKEKSDEKEKCFVFD